MSSSKREREYARKRHEKWLARQAELKARRRRRQVLTGSVLGLLALVAAVFLVLNLTSDDPPVTAETPAPTDPETPAPADPEAEPARDVPDPALAEARTWTTTLTTTAGPITMELDGAAAPQAVASFVTLAQEGYFDATSCHRLTTEGIFVLQCGDPTGTGTGGPGYAFGPVENAPAEDFYPAGTVAMARQSGDAQSMGSQFFLVYEDSTIPSDAAGGYTVFGRITQGMDVLQAVADAGATEEGGQTPATEVTIQGVDVQ
ncbi:MAG: peptidylprolyl isomerase [Actinotalea sp.]|nr:peptidylprolyl isomerase [Actinotalea sp.]